jgi:hypothetical protein
MWTVTEKNGMCIVSNGVYIFNLISRRQAQELVKLLKELTEDSEALAEELMYI